MGTPKIELHVHLEGTIRPATLLDIARRNDEPLPSDTIEGLTELYEFRDFARFIEVWILTTNCLRTADDFRQVVVDYAAQAAAFGAVYLEAIFSPNERVARGVSWDEIFSGYADGGIEAHERHGVIVRLTPDLYRGLAPEIAEQCATVAVRYRDRGVVGLGLGGMETGHPAAPYGRAFDIARDGGLGIVPHGGEADGAQAIRELLAFAPARLRHGIRAVDDAEVLAEIVDSGIVLDVCPTSNLRTGVVPSLAEHPLPALRQAGALCTINTDDPAMFGTDLAREFAIAAQLGVSAEQAYAAGLVGALCDDTTRAALGALWPAAAISAGAIGEGL
ncbi:MAG: adenosine deaminase [Dactylosporangium sp.]|nr:adenosine deaminase [Dactylosporangium sp.]NNJ61562.1 adenosine deaminase [Dactylosporangium sp.]